MLFSRGLPTLVFGFHEVVALTEPYAPKYAPRIPPSRVLSNRPQKLSPYNGTPMYFDNTDEACQFLYKPWLDHVCNRGVKSCFKGLHEVRVYSHGVHFPVQGGTDSSGSISKRDSVLLLSCSESRNLDDIPDDEVQEDGEWAMRCRSGQAPILIYYKKADGYLRYQGKCIPLNERQILKSLEIDGGVYVPGGIGGISADMIFHSDLRRAEAAKKAMATDAARALEAARTTEALVVTRARTTSIARQTTRDSRRVHFRLLPTTGSGSS